MKSDLHKNLVDAVTFIKHSLPNLAIAATFQLANDVKVVQDGKKPFPYDEVQSDDWRVSFYERINTVMPLITVFRNFAGEVVAIHKALPESEIPKFTEMIDDETLLLFQKVVSLTDEVIVPFIQEHGEEIGIEMNAVDVEINAAYHEEHEEWQSSSKHIH